jgi:hypothetical protein
MYKTDPLEKSLKRAAKKYGDKKLAKAHAAFVAYISDTDDMKTYELVMSSDNPGKSIVKWYKKSKEWYKESFEVYDEPVGMVSH